jgi:hypothetical protein
MKMFGKFTESIVVHNAFTKFYTKDRLVMFHENNC